MKNLNKIICFLSILLFVSSCSDRIILPQYTTVEKVNSLENGMTKNRVANTMSVDPFDAYHALEDGCELYSYKYVLNDQKIDPKLKNRKEGLSGNQDHYTQPKDVYVYFENNQLVDIITDLGLKFKTDLEDFGNQLESSCAGPVSGCTDVSALNYNDSATKDDGTCDYCPCDFIKNPDYDPIRNCGEKCIPINGDASSSNGSNSHNSGSDDDCSICDLVKNAGANTTINVSTVAPWSSNNSSSNSKAINSKVANSKSKSDKKNGLDKKISKLSDALEKSKAKDAKKGKVSKKTKILQKAVDKLTNK
jgi:hypothetical protein|tara:strand:+ start:40 stop:957 length:918 start_codon:yes stop_codon:yes gene_type:complete